MNNPQLSPRETEVLELLKQGNTNKQIALQLGMGSGTVNTHLHRARKKYGACSRLALVVSVLRESHAELERQLAEAHERLQKIDAVQVPDEPDAVKYLREKFGDGSKGFVRLWDGRAIAIVNLIDTLRDLLKRCRHNASVTMDELGEMRDRAEAAESKLAEKTRLVEAADSFIELAFIAHPNLDLDIDAITRAAEGKS